MTGIARIIGWVFLICIIGLATATAAERQYAPDRKVDILHITIDVTPDFKSRIVAGTTTIRFAPINRPLEELELDAIDLDVSSVTSNAKIEAYTVTDEAVTITFDPAVRPGAKTTVTVVYEAEPKRGLYFRTAEMGYPEEDTHIFTQGESHLAPNWYPNYDYPNERSSSEVICRVPPEMTVISNGRLVSEEIDSESGLKIAHWLQEKPHVNYLIALVAGKLKKIESKYKDMPIAFYTPASLIQYARRSLFNFGLFAPLAQRTQTYRVSSIQTCRRAVRLPDLRQSRLGAAHAADRTRREDVPQVCEGIHRTPCSGLCRHR